MEKKYPVLKCNEELWNEIKPVLESFGIIDFSKLGDGIDKNDLKFKTYPYLVSNYGNYYIDKFLIGNIDNPHIDEFDTLRYLVNTKEEFLSAVAKLLGKEYPIKKENNNCKKQWSKKLKKERYVVSYDPAVGKDSTVITTIPAKGNDFDKDKGSDLDIDKPMEKINIANKLKHCKKGTKLYHLMFGEVEFDGIDDDDIFVITTNKDDEKGRYYVNSFGLYDVNYPNGECLLFPSKDNRDWNNFQVLEKGHLVMCADYTDAWQLRKYISDNIAGVTNSNFENESSSWKYIVPVEEFDFTAEDITINKEKSIV